MTAAQEILAERLTQAVQRASGVPKVGLAIGRFGDRGSVVIDWPEGATAEQRAAGEAALAAFDFSDEATAAWAEAKRPERWALRQQTVQALADLDAYLARPSHTSDEVKEQVRKLCLTQRSIIRRLIKLD